MWFQSARKPHCSSPDRRGRNVFRPRLEALEDRCLLSAGALDDTFGTGGKVITTLHHGDYGYPMPVVAQPLDGNILTGGYVVGADGFRNFALTRYSADGRNLDGSFGSGGVVSTPVGTGTRGAAAVYGLAVQSDGKIVAVGTAVASEKKKGKSIDGDYAFAVLRYNPNGTLDTTFGSSHTGIVLTNVGSTNGFIDEGAFAVAIDGSGKIDVAGWSVSSGYADFTLLRFNSTGTLDITFGPNHNGIVVTPKFGNSSSFFNDVPYGMAIQPDGKIVLAGRASDSPMTMAAARYTATGLLDTTFNGSGIVWGLKPAGSSSAIAYDVVVQRNGAIVLAGSSGPLDGGSWGQTLVRLDSAGHLDTPFGSSGFSINPTMQDAHSILQAPNGDLLAAGTTVDPANTYDLGVAAFLPTSGALDTSFGAGGTGTADFGAGLDRGSGVALQPDGKIVVVGHSRIPPAINEEAYMTLARFLPPATFSASPNPAAAGGSVTLAVTSNIMSPTSTISSVVFYQDANGNGTLEAAADTLLGTATQTSPGVWTYTAPTGLGLPSGTYTLFAQATDGVNLSVPLAISFTVL